VKVELSLSLTNYDAMKMYRVLQSPRYDDVWKNGGMAPRILNLGTIGGSQWSVSCSCGFTCDKHLPPPSIFPQKLV